MSGEKIRVLLASPLPPPPGGIATWTVRILAVPTPVDIARFHVDIASHTLVHYTAALRVARLWRHACIAARFVWSAFRIRPHVVHLTTSYDAAFARDRVFIVCSRMLGAAVVLNIRGGDFERFLSNKTSAGQRRIQAILRRCAAVVAVTSETARFLSGIGLHNVKVIANCVDILPLPTSSARRIVRWLFVGWLLPLKGLVEMLEALRAFPEATLTLVGPFVDQDGRSSQAVFDETCSKLAVRERVLLRSEMRNEVVRPLYRAHDLFIFPTHREGFPNALLEAMEAALPIVATRVGGIPDMIEDGKEGLLVQPRNTAEIEAAIRTLDQDPDLAFQLGTAARRRVREQYAVDRVADAWHRLYRDVVAT